VVRSNKVVRRLPTESSESRGNPAMDFGLWTHECCFEVVYLYVDFGSGVVIIISIMIVIITSFFFWWF